MSVEDLYGNSWFKKSLKVEAESETESSTLNLDSGYGNRVRGLGVNAFDLISMSSGLDLSGLFQDEGKRKEKRFTSGAKLEVVEEKVKEIGGVLGFKVEVGKDSTAIGLVKGKVALVVQVFEILPDELLLVAVKVVEGGLEFEENHWGDWKLGLQDLVLSWYNE